MSTAIESPSLIQPINSDVVLVPEVDQIQDSIETVKEGQSSIDLEAELKFTRERLETIASEERTGADAEKIALEELQKSTESLIAIHKELDEKQTQSSSLEEGDSNKVDLQSEIDCLSLKINEGEHQWSATKEVWRREYGPIEDNYDANSSNETKANSVYDIKLLQEQITNLQKQLDAVSLRRKQMVLETEEKYKRLTEKDDEVEQEVEQVEDKIEGELEENVVS
ncbi:hypothetical protein BGZ76_009894 [Entomortierella beljakovae]|nr:hypothetical protein BGZ76_009894 [Entomortierella beljakovae]